jgi:geranylgeranyl diphosphate synthase type II
MSILANKLINLVGQEAIIPVSRLFIKTALEVCEGQMLDMEYSSKENVSIPEYLHMIGLKTSVLIAASLGIGAIVAGAREKDSTALYNFGMNLGLAFQIQDDLLDSFGDQNVFGKKIGNDILTNKRTFLLIRAFEKARGSDLAELKKYFSENNFDQHEKIVRVISIYDKLEIKRETEARISSLHENALMQLKGLDVPEERKTVLIEFSEELMKREK